MRCLDKECKYRELNTGDDIGDFYFCKLVGVTVERGNEECFEDEFIIDDQQCL